MGGPPMGGPPSPQGPSLPPGGSAPGPDAMPGDSPLLSAIAQQMGVANVQGGDTSLQGLGPQDPNLGMLELLELLELAKAGMGSPDGTMSGLNSGGPGPMGSGPMGPPMGGGLPPM